MNLSHCLNSDCVLRFNVSLCVMNYESTCEFTECDVVYKLATWLILLESFAVKYSFWYLKIWCSNQIGQSQLLTCDKQLRVVSAFLLTRGNSFTWRQTEWKVFRGNKPSEVGNKINKSVHSRKSGVMDQPREKVSWKFGSSRSTLECAEFEGQETGQEIKSRWTRSD